MSPRAFAFACAPFALLSLASVAGCFPLPAPAPAPEGPGAAGATGSPASAPTGEASSPAPTGAAAPAKNPAAAAAPDFDFPAIANDAPQLASTKIDKELDLGEGQFLTVHGRVEATKGPWAERASTSDAFTVLMPPGGVDYTLRARDAAGVDWFTHALVSRTSEGVWVNVNCHRRSDGPVSEETYEAQLVGAMMEAGGEVAKIESADMRAYELVNDKGTHLRSWFTQGQICTARLDAPTGVKLPASAQVGELFESFAMHPVSE